MQHILSATLYSKIQGVYMYCHHCGKEIKEKAVVCNGCGEPVGESGEGEVLRGRPWTLPIFLGLIIVSLSGLPGIVFGVIGLKDPAKKTQGAVLITSGILTTFFWGGALIGL